MRSALALILGAALYALAFPPFDLAAAGWLAVVPLLLAIRARPVRWAFGYGVLYGSACSWALGGSWIVPAIARFFDFGLPLAMVASSLYALAVWGVAFGVFAAGAAVVLREGSSPASRLAVPALWVATELWRGRILGQPWGLLGYSQHAELGLIQVAAITAVYGVSFLLVLGSTALADAVVLARAGETRRALLSLLLPLPLLAAVWGSGGLVIEGGPRGGFGARTVAVVQTNVSPAREWTRVYTDRQIMAHLEATMAVPEAERPALVVWPEHAVPRYLEEEPMLVAQLGDLATRRRLDLLFGAPRYESGRVYNSVRLITAAGRNGGSYDKRRLVPFAEHHPLGADADGAPSENPTQFTPGTGPLVLPSFVPLGPSICHEILFPELVARSAAAGASVLVNVSNDGWLDGGAGVASRQHFAMAVFRAIETRRYLVRAATTGVSGVVDPYGRVLATLAPCASGTLRTSVAGRTALTPYVRLGDLFALACLVAGAAVVYRRSAKGFRLPRRLVPAAAAPRRWHRPARAR